MYGVDKDSIASIIKERIDNFELNIDVNNSGKIVSYTDGVAEVYGIKNIIAGELVEFENNEKGLVSFVGESSSTVVILGKGNNIKEGMVCNKSFEKLTAPNITKSLKVRNDNMNKKNMLSMASVGALMTVDYLGDVYGKKKTPSDIRCKEKKVAKRRAKNKNKKKGK